MLRNQLFTQDQTSDFPKLIVNNKITYSLFLLCRYIAKKKMTACPDQSADVATWNAWMQQHFLRPANVDHRDLRQADNDQTLLPWFKALGLVDEKPPRKKHYPLWVIFGGTVWDSRERISYVKQLWQSGRRARKVIYINGLRPIGSNETLDVINNENGVIPNRENWKPCEALPAYQHEAAQIVWDQLIDDPELNSIFTLTTLQPIIPGKFINTLDTVKFIFNEFPAENNILFISNAPYAPYQSTIVEQAVTELGRNIATETVSPALIRESNQTAFLDTIARRMYALNDINKSLARSSLSVVAAPDQAKLR